LLRAKIEEFTRLADELQDNLDTYDQQHADIRKALKELVPQSEKWQPVLNQPGPDPGYDFVRKTAVEAAKSVSDQTKELQKDQEKYFAEHKDQAGKNGTGPQ
jgi:prefoldin subunit 5